MTSLPITDVIDRLAVLVLFPHNRCNCRCLMCDIWKIRDGEEITPEDLDRLLPDLARLDVRQVVFSGGEPLMHSDLAALARPLRQRGIKVTLLSSGVSLPSAGSRMGEIADELIVSLDGPPAIHDSIRRVRGAFENLAAGVVAVRRALGPDFRITARCTVQKANGLQLRETVQVAHEIELDGISFLAVDVSTSAFNRPDGNGAGQKGPSLALTGEDLPRFSAELEALILERAEDFRTGFIAESPEKLRRNLFRYFSALAGREEFPAAPCNAPWVSAVIETDGTVRPCFFHRPIGSLRDTPSLSDLLNSAGAVEFRRNLDVATDPVCKRCVCRLNLKSVDPRR